MGRYGSKGVLENHHVELALALLDKPNLDVLSSIPGASPLSPPLWLSLSLPPSLPLPLLLHSVPPSLIQSYSPLCPSSPHACPVPSLPFLLYPSLPFPLDFSPHRLLRCSAVRPSSAARATRGRICLPALPVRSPGFAHRFSPPPSLPAALLGLPLSARTLPD